MRANKRNYSVWIPSDINTGEILTLNMKFLMRVETNLKLNLLDFEGNSLIDLNDEEAVSCNEVHFLQMESIVERQEMSLGLVWRMIKRIFGNRPNL